MIKPLQYKLFKSEVQQKIDNICLDAIRLNINKMAIIMIVLTDPGEKETIKKRLANRGIKVKFFNSVGKLNLNVSNGNIEDVIF